MTLKEISEKLGISHASAYRLVNSLVENGLIEVVQEKNNKYIIKDNDFELVKELNNLVKSGFSRNKAVEILKEKNIKSDNIDFFIAFNELKEEIQSLKKENIALKELLQVYLSKIDKLEDQIKALPKPREPFWKKITKLFKG